MFRTMQTQLAAAATANSPVNMSFTNIFSTTAHTVPNWQGRPPRQLKREREKEKDIIASSWLPLDTLPHYHLFTFSCHSAAKSLFTSLLGTTLHWPPSPDT